MRVCVLGLIRHSANTAPHSSTAALQQIQGKWAYQSCERQAVKSAEWEFL